jgi:phosphatidyl-myo-inositol dimannoside synthase
MQPPSIPRTLVVTNDFPPRIGGVQQYVFNLVGELPPDRVTLMAPRWEGWREHDATLPYKVVRFSGKALVPIAETRRRVLALAREARAEVALLASGFPVSAFGPDLARAGIPHLCVTHGVEYWVARSPGLARMMGRSMSQASRVTVISDYIRRKVRPVVPDHVPISLCPPGVNVGRFTPDVSGEQARMRHGLSDRRVVVCVSRLVPRKGQDVLIDCMASVRRREPDATLLLVGDGPYRRKLEVMAGRAPTGSVVFAGAVADEQLPAYHAAADVFAMPCRSRWGGLEVEGFGIVFMEAAATGRAAVAGNSGGAAEAVQDGATGLVVNGRNRPQVARAVIELLSDPGRASEMAAAGRARAKAEYSWDQIAGKVAGWLAEAVA